MPDRGDIRDWEAVQNARCNWSWLAPAWGNTKISPSDIDFVVERRGYFLFVERKASRAGLSRGQEILLRQLAKAPKTTVACLVGAVREREIEPKEMLVIGEDEWKPVNRAGFLEFCSQWFARANRGGS